MKKTKQVEVKKQKEKEEPIVSSIEDDLTSGYSNIADFKTLLADSFDFTRNVSNSKEEPSESKSNLNELFLLNTSKLSDALKSEAFYLHLLDRKEDISFKRDYFNQSILQVFDRQADICKEKFIETYALKLEHKIKNQDHFVTKADEVKPPAQKEFLPTPLTTEQSIDDWLDDLIN